MRLHNTGQTALEFLVLIGFMLFVFTAFTLIIKERGAVTQQQAQYDELSSVAQALNQEVSNANRVQDGYERVFELPQTVNGEPYTLTLVSNSEVTVRTANNEYLLFLPVNVTALNGSGVATMELTPGRNTITKEDGNITIKPALSEIITCNFIDSYQLPVSCFPSTGGHCKTLPGETSCKVKVHGTMGQQVTWTSSCGTQQQVTTFTAENKTVNLTCLYVSETFRCQFTPGSIDQTCWTDKTSCAGKPYCDITLSGLFNTKIVVDSSCAGAQEVTLDGNSNNNQPVQFNCNNPVAERVTCLFLESRGVQHRCSERNTPAINCTGVDSCAMEVQALPGRQMEWVSDNCEAQSLTFMTREGKVVPFFCGRN